MKDFMFYLGDKLQRTLYLKTYSKSQYGDSILKIRLDHWFREKNYMTFYY